MYVSQVFTGESFILVVLKKFFEVWETKKVVAGCIRQVVVIYSNDCIRICLGGLSIGHLRQVVICTGLTVILLCKTYCLLQPSSAIIYVEM